MIAVKRWLYNLLYDPYSERAKAFIFIGLCVGIAVFAMCLAWVIASSQPQPAPAYRAVPTVTIAPAPTVGGCIRFDTAPEYYTSHPNVTPCGE